VARALCFTVAVEPQAKQALLRLDHLVHADCLTIGDLDRTWDAEFTPTRREHDRVASSTTRSDVALANEARRAFSRATRRRRNDNKLAAFHADRRFCDDRFRHRIEENALGLVVLVELQIGQPWIKHQVERAIAHARLHRGVEAVLLFLCQLRRRLGVLLAFEIGARRSKRLGNLWIDSNDTGGRGSRRSCLVVGDRRSSVGTLFLVCLSGHLETGLRNVLVGLAFEVFQVTIGFECKD
jgi:hypothetical protein